jgi:hypothetical protein
MTKCKDISAWKNGECCCNCKNHFEDFYSCISRVRPKNENKEKCVCSIHKGWVCLISFEGEIPQAHSDWCEHGYCECYTNNESI